ncbi:MAG: DUF222 domain-containing protein [Streptosporangiaceae bacterium]
MPAERSPRPGERGEDVPPHAGDDWGQDAVLDDLMAAFGFGPEEDPPDDGSGPGFESGPGLDFGPGLDVGPGLDEFLDGPSSGPDRSPLNECAVPVPESMDAGFLPRGGTGRPKLAGGGRGAGFASGAELDRALPGPALAGFADDAAGSDRRYAGLNDDQLIGALLGWQKTEAWAASGKLSAVAELIRRRPNDAARGGGPDGPPAVWGKFCADELAVAVASSQRAAERMLGVAYDLAFRLPLTARALREGRIDSYKAQIIAEVTRVLDDAGAAAAEALILAGMAGKTPGQIRVMIGRAVLQVDPDAARQRREQAQRDARVGLWREDAGTAALCGFGLPPDEALAADQMISSRARDSKRPGWPAPWTSSASAPTSTSCSDRTLPRSCPARTRQAGGTPKPHRAATPGTQPKTRPMTQPMTRLADRIGQRTSSGAAVTRRARAPAPVATRTGTPTTTPAGIPANRPARAPATRPAGLPANRRAWLRGST